MFDKLRKYHFGMHDLCKLLAFILMITDHIGLFVFNNNIVLRLLGRLSFPIFACIYGYNFKNKLNNKLFIIAFPVLIIDYITYHRLFFNILYSFILASYLMIIYNTKLHKQIYKIFFLSFILLSHFILKQYIDYGLFAFFFMLSTNNKNIHNKLILFILTFASYFISSHFTFSFTNIQQYILLIALSIECIYLYLYKNYILLEVDNKFSIIIKIISRYSSQLFLLQSFIFGIIHYLKK